MEGLLLSVSAILLYVIEKVETGTEIINTTKIILNRSFDLIDKVSRDKIVKISGGRKRVVK